MAKSHKRVFKTTIRVPVALGDRIEEMAFQRDMELDELLAELVQLGERCLRHDRIPLEVRQQGDGTHALRNP